jgi:signal transduction histidine kinase
MKASPRRETSLRHRITAHFAMFAALMAVILAAGAWFFLIEAEDAGLETVFDRALTDFENADWSNHSLPSWIKRYGSAEEVRKALPLPQVPSEPGLHVVFTDEGGQRALLIDSWAARLRMWAHGLEQEYRLRVEKNPRTGESLFFIADWQVLEHTERIFQRLIGDLLLFGIAMGLSSLWLGRRLAQSAIQPVLELAEKVRQRGRSSLPLAQSQAVSETAFLAREFDAAFTQLAETNERERQFIADCSHEFRTPLTILGGAVALLKERDTVDSGILARLHRTTKRMEGITQTFLVMAREGRMSGERERLSVRAIVSQVLEEQSLVFPHQPSEIKVEIPEDVRVFCVREVFHVILGNLIGNAFQHAPECPLGIQWLRSSPFSATPGLRILSIADCESDPRAASAGETRPSYGFGLSIVDRLCQLQQWRIEPHTDSGTGCVIWMSE